MTEVLRVLIVEDLPTDAELEEREVRLVRPQAEFLCVESREDFLAALGAFRPDIILSDYKLPQFDGMAALQLAQERVPEVPFIIVTGSQNEDTAVACMKAGAWDYVIKEHIKRLGPAVLGGLEQKCLRLERKQAEDKIKSQLEELQRWQDVMLGREDRVQELKHEVNELCRRLGETARYPSQEAGPASRSGMAGG